MVSINTEKNEKFIFSSILIFFGISAFPQIAQDKYWVSFTDKIGTPFTLEQPEDYLSPRSIARREAQGIQIDSLDLPVNPAYVIAVRDMGVEILNVSKWLNGVTIYTTNPNIINDISQLNFVNSVSKSKKKKGKNKNSLEPMPYFDSNFNLREAESSDYFDYGLCIDQIYIHNGQVLHNEGFRGEGMLIAITDAGFQGYDLPAFDSIRNNNQVVGTKNFLNKTESVFNYSEHGMNVLSILAGNIPGQLIGSAPYANYLLLVTEDAASEQIIEEINWSCGAEYADSAGADLISVSLGYFDYDFPNWSHSVAELDGNTAWVSRAANVAVGRGMIVVVAAGNNGDEEIPYISMPGDSYEVVTVGAVGADSIRADFSSIGPTSDGRIKPDVCAIGYNTYCQQSFGGVWPGSGTSFATPVMSGLIACLWQAHPEMNRYEVISAVINAGNMFSNPDNFMGAGIPNFQIAHNNLSNVKYLNTGSDCKLFIAPNPFSDSISLSIRNLSSTSFTILITSIDGKALYADEFTASNTQEANLVIHDLSLQGNGMYLLHLDADNIHITRKIVKTGK